MKISFNSNIFVNKINLNLLNSVPQTFKGGIRFEDIFVKDSNYFEPINDRIKNPFDTAKRKFDISDYKKLSKAQVDGVRNAKDNLQTKKKAERDVVLALTLKEFLDDEYGKNKYVFECIGTSPSTIGRVFEFMGVETHYLPISGFRLFSEDNINRTVENQKKGRKAYSKFLKEQGLDKKQIEKSDKIHVFYDYTSTGKTFRMYQMLLKEFFDISSESGNVKFRIINDDLEIATKSNYDEEICDDDQENELKPMYESYLDEELNRNGAAVHGGIPHLSFTELININNVTKSTTGLNSKIYNFFVMDILNKKGLLKSNPKNKNSL